MQLVSRLKFFGFVKCYTLFYFVFILFQYPSLENVHDIKAHTTDVDDLDVHPNSRQVSVFIPSLEERSYSEDWKFFWQYLTRNGIIPL